MTTKQKQEPSDVARYITVRDAVEIVDRTERTIRRWIEKGEIHTVRDKSGFLRLNLAEVEERRQSKGAVVPSLREQNQSLQERIEELERTREAQQRQYNDLQTEIEAIQQQVTACMQLLATMLPTSDSGQSIGQHQMLTDVLAQLTQRHSRTTGELLEKRKLLPGTVRLVDFAKLHQIKLSELKKLHALHQINLEVYQRKTDAIRNKQEWWITPLQHQQVADYCRLHTIPYLSCPQCEQQKG